MKTMEYSSGSRNYPSLLPSRNDGSLPRSFADEWADINGIQVSMESWESEAERGLYREKAERNLDYYRTDIARLEAARTALAGFTELEWEDVFDPSTAMRGIRYDREHVMTSGISDEPYQCYAAAETKLEQNKREKKLLEADIRMWEVRIEKDKLYLTLLRGNTAKVAELTWFGERSVTQSMIADELGVSRSTVQRERDRAIETVALYLKRTEYGKLRSWFM